LQRPLVNFVKIVNYSSGMTCGNIPTVNNGNSIEYSKS
jgi:hypothetical protein